MKVALFFSAIAGASAFAPASQPARVASELSAAAELDGMRGTGPETGGKVVSGYRRTSSVPWWPLLARMIFLT